MTNRTQATEDPKFAEGTTVMWVARDMGRVGTVLDSWTSLRKDGSHRRLVTVKGTCGTEFALGEDEVSAVERFVG